MRFEIINQLAHNSYKKFIIPNFNTSNFVILRIEEHFTIRDSLNSNSTKFMLDYTANTNYIVSY